MSHTGQCPSCGEAALVANITGLRDHRGPAFERWRRAMARSVGAITVDDLLDN